MAVVVCSPITDEEQAALDAEPKNPPATFTAEQVAAAVGAAVAAQAAGQDPTAAAQAALAETEQQ